MDMVRKLTHTLQVDLMATSTDQLLPLLLLLHLQVIILTLCIHCVCDSVWESTCLQCEHGL